MMEAILLNLPEKNVYSVEEAYKVLRTNLLFCGRDIKVIAVTSCREKEGKTTVALHLAKSFTDLDKKVLVIDADMRRSHMAERCTSVKNPAGLREVLSGQAAPVDCIYPVKDSSLSLLFSGRYLPHPVDLLSGASLAALIEECRKEYDYIIIDTPPLGRYIDAALAAEQSDGVLLVFSDPKVRLGEVNAVATAIRMSGSKILGAVRNEHKPAKRKRRKNNA